MEIDLKSKIDGIYKQVSQEAKSRGYRAANELRNASLQVLRGQRSGRIYRKPFSKSTYQASAPGEPPAARSPGGLRVSWQPQAKSEKEGGTVTIRPAIWTGKTYAPLLQDGTPKMKPRPFEEPIIDQAKPAILAIYQAPYLS